MVIVKTKEHDLAMILLMKLKMVCPCFGCHTDSSWLLHLLTMYLLEMKADQQVHLTSSMYMQMYFYISTQDTAVNQKSLLRCMCSGSVGNTTDFESVVHSGSLSNNIFPVFMATFESSCSNMINSILIDN